MFEKGCSNGRFPNSGFLPQLHVRITQEAFKNPEAQIDPSTELLSLLKELRRQVAALKQIPPSAPSLLDCVTAFKEKGG